MTSPPTETTQTITPKSTSWSTAKTNSLFFRWLSTPEAQVLINTVCTDIAEGRPTAIPSPTEHTKTLTQSSPQRLLRKNLAGLDAAAAAAAASSSHGSGTNHVGGATNNNNNNPPSTSPSSEGPLTLKLDKLEAYVTPPPPSPSTRPKVLKKKSSAGSMVGFTKEQHAIPQFYEPGVGAIYRKEKSDAFEKKQPEITAIFASHPNGITVEDFVPICRDLLNFPLCFCETVFRRIRLLYGVGLQTRNQAVDGPFPNPTIPYNPGYQSEEEKEENEMLCQGTISEHDFCLWWRAEVEPFDRAERFFRLIKQPHAQYATAHDFFPVVRSLVENHPGLVFLEGTIEFQEKYARTVVARIMARTNTSWTGDISLREMRRSDLLDYFLMADKMEEINDVNEYFSYEHFYVIYCKFWELDQDHDFLITRDDLLRYSGHALTVGIVDRIFQEPAVPFTSRVPGKMGFEDFVWFILFEEDKTNPYSIRFWFSCVDLDGDGKLCAWEVKQFYDEQLRRMQSLGHEEVSFQDVEVQILDCLRGGKQGMSSSIGTGLLSSSASWSLSLRDFLDPQALPQCGLFFNLLFNLSKFAAAENRDPFTARQMAEDGMTDWDRFALTEYSRLAGLEEERAARADVEVVHTATANVDTIRTDLSDSSEEWAESPSNKARGGNENKDGGGGGDDSGMLSTSRFNDEEEEVDDDEMVENSSEANTSEDGLDAHAITAGAPSPLPSRSASLSSMEDGGGGEGNVLLRAPPRLAALRMQDMLAVREGHADVTVRHVVVDLARWNVEEFWLMQAAAL